MQNLFAEKIREYGEKKASAGGKLVEASEKTLADLQAELDKVGILRNNLLPNLIFFAQVAKNYGGGAGVDMTSFPELKFADPAIDSINISS